MTQSTAPVMYLSQADTREDPRISIDAHISRELIDLRIWFRCDEVEHSTAQKGVTLHTKSLPDLIKPLNKLQAIIDEGEAQCI
ncbi:hypothetical protein [Maritimibacter alkaliphilus]|uniref:hypothetical protein n=1 Tax=Maritimibacter alkaliphilus TaxID=404236 RepID=UPI001C962370|nr:hypothetical protein [Maritimibacter alkaliphilus]MBY6088956.1 hypothetical protein [Maritimibacter alkaliphilus]